MSVRVNFRATRSRTRPRGVAILPNRGSSASRMTDHASTRIRRASTSRRAIPTAPPVGSRRESPTPLDWTPRPAKEFPIARAFAAPQDPARSVGSLKFNIRSGAGRGSGRRAEKNRPGRHERGYGMARIGRLRPRDVDSKQPSPSMVERLASTRIHCAAQRLPKLASFGETRRSRSKDELHGATFHLFPRPPRCIPHSAHLEKPTAFPLVPTGTVGTSEADIKLFLKNDLRRNWLRSGKRLVRDSAKFPEHNTSKLGLGSFGFFGGYAVSGNGAAQLCEVGFRWK